MAELNISRLFFVLILFYLSGRANGKANFEALVDAKLKQLNKPAVKTIQSEDGDIIDCVDIYKQPVFDNPLLKNHVIQMKPSFDLKQEKSSTENESLKPLAFQTWQRSGRCPEGTVPIRRIRREDLLRAESIDRFGRKPRAMVSKSNTTNQKDGHLPFLNSTNIVLPTKTNESVALLYTIGPDFIGATGDINVWNPRLGSPTRELTTAQIWVKSGPAEVYESVEAGWIVFPNLYGDNRTRFFTHWTLDGTTSTGCYDLNCDHGFVHTNPGIALGAAIEPLSILKGQQYYISVGIYKDPQTNNWWLKVWGDTPVGYWPGNIFSYLSHSSTLVEWGGLVFSDVQRPPHTTAGMGSGHLASGLHKTACYIKNIGIVDFSWQLKYPEWVGTWDNEFNCYSVYIDEKSNGTSPVFYFGGPGRNPDCP